MPGHEREHDRGLLIRIEVGPVHRNLYVAARPHHVTDPVEQDGVDVDPIVGQQPVHLLDRVFGDQAARQCEPLTDRIDRQRRGSDDPERGVGERQHAFGMRIAVEQAGQEAVHVLQKPRVLSGFIVYPAHRVACREIR